MRHAYLVVSVGVFAVGAWYILDDVLESSDFFHGVGAIAGLAVVLTGSLNLLNQAYGATAVGVRVAALGANLALLGLALGWADQPSSWIEWVLIGLLTVATLLGFSRRSLKLESPPSNPPLQPPSGGGASW